jgi:hypothetical protein
MDQRAVELSSINAARTCARLLEAVESGTQSIQLRSGKIEANADIVIYILHVSGACSCRLLTPCFSVLKCIFVPSSRLSAQAHVSKSVDMV